MNLSVLMNTNIFEVCKGRTLVEIASVNVERFYKVLFIYIRQVLFIYIGEVYKVLFIYIRLVCW